MEPAILNEDAVGKEMRGVNQLKSICNSPPSLTKKVAVCSNTPNFNSLERKENQKKNENGCGCGCPSSFVGIIQKQDSELNLKIKNNKKYLMEEECMPNTLETVPPFKPEADEVNFSKDMEDVSFCLNRTTLAESEIKPQVLTESKTQHGKSLLSQYRGVEIFEEEAPAKIRLGDLHMEDSFSFQTPTNIGGKSPNLRDRWLKNDKIFEGKFTTVKF